jgi:uncharacterized protein
MSTALQPQPLLAQGEVRHRRLRPVAHAFAYPTWFVLLPLRALRAGVACALPRNTWGLASFHDRDHGEGGSDALAWFEALLAAEGVDDADGEIWLQTLPRVLGYAFKPVSFWFAHRADGTLAAVLAEVNNTFGERHGYLLHGPQLAWGRTLSARKVLHVSPFCRVAGEYRFRFLQVDARPAATPVGPPRAQARSVARIDLHDDAGPLLQTSWSASLHVLDPAALRRAVWRTPWLTLGIVARIHLQALRLLVRRVPWFAKPSPPDAFVTR